MPKPLQLFSNNAKGRLNAGIGAAATACTLGAGQGALFPTPTGGDWFMFTFIKSDGSIEVCKCTQRTGDTFDVIVRAQEGTSPLVLLANDRVEMRVTKGTLEFLSTLQAGKHAVPVVAASMIPRVNNGCAALNVTAGAADQPDIPYLAFDGAAKEFASFHMRMPRGWDEGTITAAFDWRRASGTGAANVKWGIRAIAVSDGDSPAASFGAEATVVDAAQTSTPNFSLSGETGACTIGGGPAEGDLVFFEVFRDGADVADTLDGVDAWLTGVTLFMTTNAPTDD